MKRRKLMVPVPAEHRDREVGSTNSHSPTVGLSQANKGGK